MCVCVCVCVCVCACVRACVRACVCVCVCVLEGELLQTHPHVQGGGSCLPISSSQVECSDANLVLNIHTGSLLKEITNTVGCTSAEGNTKQHERLHVNSGCVYSRLGNRPGGKVPLHLLTWQLSAAVFVLLFQTGS